MIADGLHISSERALDLFYQSHVYEMLVDPRYGLQIMSDTYVYDEFMMEYHSLHKLEATEKWWNIDL